MISRDEFFSQTEVAVKMLIEFVASLKNEFQKTLNPVSVFQYEEEKNFQQVYKEWREKPEVVEAYKQASIAKNDLDGRLFSYQVMAGSLLQIASQAISLYAKPVDIREKYDCLIKGMRKNFQGANKFNNGRIVRGVPIGLVIYAGRNQYNHISAGADLAPINVNIFSVLARYEYDEHQYIDPAFNLENPHLDCFASNVVSILNWEKYEVYLDDLNEILG